MTLREVSRFFLSRQPEQGPEPVRVWRVQWSMSSPGNFHPSPSLRESFREMSPTYARNKGRSLTFSPEIARGGSRLSGLDDR